MSNQNNNQKYIIRCDRAGVFYAEIAAFIKEHPVQSAKIPARELWIWHNRLTGSCEMGRNQFAADRGIDIDNDAFTPLEFCEMCRDSYGGDTIKRLEAAYAENET